MDTNETDLIIVGGGVLGTFHAYHAMKSGLSVRLFERHERPRGATVRNFGQVVPSGMDQKWQAFGRQSLEIYQSIQSQFDISVRRNGSLYIASDAEEVTLLEELHSINADNDYASELWTAQHCCERYPQLRTDYVKAGLFFPDEVSVNPRKMIHSLHDILSQGAQGERLDVHYSTPIVSAQERGGKAIVTTSDGREFAAQKVIVCSGSEFKTLFPELFSQSDLVACKLQMLRLKPMANVKLPGNILTGLSIRRYEAFSQCPSWQAIKAAETADSFAKKWGVHILLKQEVDGSIILGDSHEYASAKDIDQIGFDTRQELNNFFVDEAKKIFDLPHWEIETAWSGMYCQTKHPSGIFQHRVGNCITIVTGIGGKGMTSSAGFAKQSLSEIIDA